MAGVRNRQILPALWLTLAFGLLSLGFPAPHPGGLAPQIAEVVQLRAADFRRASDLDLLDRRRVQREDALDALPERHLADREGRARATSMQADDDTLEDLDALLVTFPHLDRHLDGVARLHRRTIG